MVGAEMPMTSDQVVWSEQNRLHVAYKENVVAEVDGEATQFQITLTLGGDPNGAVRKGQTILITDSATGLTETKALVQNVTGANLDVLTVSLYETTYADLPANIKDGPVDLFVYGSEFAKGSVGMQGTIQPQFTQYLTHLLS
jgi:hypothetical protein